MHFHLKMSLTVDIVTSLLKRKKAVQTHLPIAKQEYHDLTATLEKTAEGTEDKWGVQKWKEESAALDAKRGHTLKDWRVTGQKGMMKRIENFSWCKVNLEQGRHNITQSYFEHSRLIGL